jgi:hypothetical protein
MSGVKGNKHSAKWTDTRLLARACLHAKRGKSKTDCFRLIGVHPDTGFAWLKQGREGIHPELERFERIFERCVAHFSSRMVDMVEAAASSGAPNTWQAAMTLLERRDPANWGRRDALALEATKGPVIQLNQVVLVDGDVREESRALLRRVTGFSADESLGIGVGGEPEEVIDGNTVVVDSR